MLDRLAETFIAGVELLEAEGRVAADRAAGLAWATVLLFICGLVGLLGAVAATVGLTLVLAESVGWGGALGLVGGLVFAVAMLGGLVLTRRLTKGHDPLDDLPDDRMTYPPEYPE